MKRKSFITEAQQQFLLEMVEKSKLHNIDPETKLANFEEYVFSIMFKLYPGDTLSPVEETMLQIYEEMVNTWKEDYVRKAESENTGIKLDEKIKRYASNAEFERTHDNLQGCLEFRQLAEWLKELKQLREQVKSKGRK